MWIGGRCLGARLPIRNPLVDGAGDTMLRAIRDLVVIVHILGVNMNEWVEIVAAEAERAFGGLGHILVKGGDEERESSLNMQIYYIYTRVIYSRVTFFPAILSFSGQSKSNHIFS